MATLSGNGELSVGIKILDCDHREMTDAIYEIEQALAMDGDPRQTSSLLHRLAEFTLTHFALEEGMMAATKYPKMKKHRNNHQRMMEQVKALATRYDREGLTLDRPSLISLTELHILHIQNDDVDYGRWLNEHGMH